MGSRYSLECFRRPAAIRVQFPALPPVGPAQFSRCEIGGQAEDVVRILAKCRLRPRFRLFRFFGSRRCLLIAAVTKSCRCRRCSCRGELGRVRSISTCAARTSFRAFDRVDRTVPQPDVLRLRADGLLASVKQDHERGSNDT